MRPAVFSKLYWVNNMAFILCLFLFGLVNLGLFMQRCAHYMRNLDAYANFWIILARANGQCLNFNSTFILVAVLRRSITKLRDLGLAVCLPLDKNIYFHKLTGRLIFFQAMIHTLAHLVNHGTYDIIIQNVSFLPRRLES